MLDLAELPKNANGFRTTHTCELCGFEPKTKNKYREKQDHLVMKHFKERIDKIFPQSRPYSCPSGECEFTGKDKQALLRHYTGKHGVLELYLREALAAKGIEYHMSDNAKRKMNSDPGHHNKRPAKEARLTPPGQTKLTAAVHQQQQHHHHTYRDMNGGGGGVSPPQQHLSVLAADTTTPLPSLAPPLAAAPVPQGGRLPSVSTVLTQTSVGGGGVGDGLIEREVEAMLASFHPAENQVVFSLPQLPNDPLSVDDVVSSTTPDSILPCSGIVAGGGGGGAASSKLVNDPGIMWGGGGHVMMTVESNQTVPVQYETSDPAGYVNLGDIDYDYLYPATIESAALATAAHQQAHVGAGVPAGQERQLTFSML